MDRLELEAAVDWLAGDFKRRTGIPCTVEGLGSGAPIDPDVSAFFRIL